MRVLFTSVVLLAFVGVCFASIAGCHQSAAVPVAVPAVDTVADGVPADLAKLSPADRDAALAQKICPVTGEPLGSMGVPPKVVVEGREVFLCCAGCEETLREDPAKHLAKLDD